MREKSIYGVSGLIKIIAKKQNNPKVFKEIVKKIRSHKILVQGAFVVGFDGDTVNIFHMLKKLIKESKMDAFQLNILYPYPGTKIRERLIREGRLTSNDWGNYMLDGVNFIPKNMTQDELNKGYRRILKNNSTIPIIIIRTIRALFKLGIHGAFLTYILNVGVRRNYKELITNPNPIRRRVITYYPEQISHIQTPQNLSL